MKNINEVLEKSSAAVFNLSMWASDDAWALYEDLQSDSCIAAHIDEYTHWDFPLLLGRMIRSGNIKPVDKIMNNSWMKSKLLKMASRVDNARTDWFNDSKNDPGFIGSNGYLWVADDILSVRFFLQRYGELPSYRQLDESYDCTHTIVTNIDIQDLRRFTPRIHALQ
jgi:hypothetical protein